MGENITFTNAQASALDFSRHIALTANAGSGKTFVLTQRLLSILVNSKDENISLKNIAAITFTKKAAAELYSKIAKALDEKIDSVTDEDEKKRFDGYRKSLLSAQITTIDSFCGNIVREFPVVANVDPDFSILDEYSSSQLFEDSLAKFHKENKDDVKLHYVLRILKGVTNFDDAMNEFRKSIESVEIIKQNIYSGRLEEISSNLASIQKEYLNHYAVKLLKDGILLLEHINNCALALSSTNKYAAVVKDNISRLKTLSADNNNLDEILLIINDIRSSAYTIKFTPADKYYKKKEQSITESEFALLDELFTVSETLANSADMFPELAKFGKYIMDLSEKVFEIYTTKKYEKGFLDFIDVVMLTKKILATEDAQKKLAERFKYIMIDEFQDTNQLQYDIFMPILDQLKKGNLFIVGDEKQSIYMFRNAELEVFTKTKADIQAASGENASITLKESFRMAPELGIFVNKLFSKLFRNPADSGKDKNLFNESEYSEIIYIEKELKKGTVTVLLSNEPKSDKEEDVEANEGSPLSEDELIARQIVKIKNEINCAWKDIAILSFYGKSFEGLRTVFPKYKIPYLIYGGKGFYQSQTVIDLNSYLLFLNDTTNDIALAALLRSPFYLLDDNTLLNTASSEGITLYDKMKTYSLENEKIAGIYKTLSSQVEKAKYSMPSVLLRTILSDTFFLGIMSQRADNEQIFADIEKVVSYAIERERNGFQNFYDFSEFLNKSITNETDESHSPISFSSDAVQVMTVHKSKGLQFKVVFVINTNTAFIKQSLKQGSVYCSKKFGIISKLPNDGNFFEEHAIPKISFLYNSFENRKLSAENKRLMYVALTRAEEHIVISGTISKDSANANSMLNYLSGVFPDILSSDVDISGTIKVLKTSDIQSPPEDIKFPIVIKVLNDIEEQTLIDSDEKKEIPNYHVSTGAVAEEKDVFYISASVYVKYLQCPMLYHLSNNLKLDKFYDALDTGNTGSALYEKREPASLDNISDSKSLSSLKSRISRSEFPKLRGTIIHKLLEILPEPESVQTAIDSSFGEYQNYENFAEIKDEVIQYYHKFIATDLYSALKGSANASSEYLVSAVVKDKIYLQGIIDKILKTDDEIQIYDWKSDKVTNANLEEKCINYEHQLLFYAYLASKLSPEIKNISANLVFLNADNYIYTKNYSEEDFKIFEDSLIEMCKSIDSRNYPKNLTNCSKCRFAQNDGACVVKD